MSNEAHMAVAVVGGRAMSAQRCTHGAAQEVRRMAVREGACTWSEEQTDHKTHGTKCTFSFLQSCELLSRSASALEWARLSDEPCALAIVCIRYPSEE
jgi:hypothetical protein